MPNGEWIPEPPYPSTRVDCSDPGAVRRLAACLAWHVLSLSNSDSPVVIVCIGTDRSTGDALGPLVGSRLREAASPDCEVWGTLDEPVHAGNLNDVVKELAVRHQESLVIAVDACLGQSEQVGTICLRTGPVRPGAGVNKVLPAVGKLHITGTVNIGGFMEYLVLQNTRLSLVMRMARVIADSIMLGLRMAKQARREAVSCLPSNEILV